MNYNIIVGDNPITDILGALRAGWQAVWFNQSGAPAPEALSSANLPYSEVVSLDLL